VSIVEAIDPRDATNPVPATRAAIRKLGSFRDSANRKIIRPPASSRIMSAMVLMLGDLKSHL
jgi:hypothetical protein